MTSVNSPDDSVEHIPDKLEQMCEMLQVPHDILVCIRASETHTDAQIREDLVCAASDYGDKLDEMQLIFADTNIVDILWALKRSSGNADIACELLFSANTSVASDVKDHAVAGTDPGTGDHESKIPACRVQNKGNDALSTFATMHDADEKKQAKEPTMPLQDAQALLPECIKLHDRDTLKDLLAMYPALLHTADAAGYTPLALAHALGPSYRDVIHFFLERGADPGAKTKSGWSLFQAACLRQERDIALDMYVHMMLLKQKQWMNDLPKMRKLLTDTEEFPDFYIEINWKIETWVPFLSSMAPSDTFRIWKRGEKLRFDSTFRGMSGVNVQKGHLSLLLIEAGVFLVDHEAQWWSDVLEAWKNPNFDRMAQEVDAMIASNVGRSDVDTTAVAFEQQRSFFGSPTVEQVGDFNCHIYDMEGLSFASISQKSGDGAPQYLDYDAYALTLQDSNSATTSTAASANASSDVSSSMTVSRKDVSASIWMADEKKFPVKKEHIILILQLLKPGNPDLSKILDILQLDELPGGFPVKMQVPVAPTVTATVTFQNYRVDTEDDWFFSLPAYAQRTF
jgi:ankyrin repeat domain-containing protein 13